MRLLFICESFPTSSFGDFTGGVEARDFHVASRLAVKSHVTVITNSRQGVASDDYLNRIHVIRVGQSVPATARQRPLVRIRFFLSAVKTGLNQQFDLVQGTNIFSQAAAFIIGHLTHKPKIALVHDVYLGSWYTNTPLLTALIGEVLERVVLHLPWTHLIANSQVTKSKLIRHGLKPPSISVIHGGVNNQLCRSLKVNKYSRPTIVFAGRLVKYKNVDTLIHALPYIKYSIPHIRLIIIGDGPQLPKLRQQAYQQNLQHHVAFTGFMSSHHQVLKKIKQSHLFCLPSTVEGFGLVTLEALACCVPFVATAIPATIELTHKGEGGLFFTPGNHLDLSHQVVKLLTNQALYQQKLKQAKTLARTYDWSIIARRTTYTLQSIIHEHSNTS